MSSTLIWGHRGPPTLADRAILQCVMNAGGAPRSLDELMMATALSGPVLRLHLAGLLRAGWLSRSGATYHLHCPPIPPRRD